MHEAYLGSDVHIRHNRVHSSASSCLHAILLLALHQAWRTQA